MPERVAIVGSRGFQPLDVVREYVRTLPADAIVVSGGAPGVDLAAENEARRLGLKRQIYAAHWWTQGRFDRAAGFRRNALIVAACDRLVAFWDGASEGTQDTIAKARAAGKPFNIGMWVPGAGLIWGES